MAAIYHINAGTSAYFAQVEDDDIDQADVSRSLKKGKEKKQKKEKANKKGKNKRKNKNGKGSKKAS